MTTRKFDSFSDLSSRVGEELGISDWFEVTQERISAFASASDDFQWIHLDVERARAESPYRATIAHGFLTLSLLVPLYGSALSLGGSKMVVNYGLNRVRFTSAVLAGDRIRARFTLLEYVDLDPGAQFTWKCTVEREGAEKPAVVAEWIKRHYP
ncbi:MAG TPA: MaoC family dehydratase [Steroidobacteraceae bacterium]|nr:MaoC family dehydratase [Steroidobacteraceae bacterium]